MRITFTGFDEYLSQLQKLTEEAEESCKRVLWEGARVIADEIHDGLNDIPTQDEYVKKGEKRTGVTTEQKAGIQAGFGLSKMKTNGGSVDIVAGWHGETDGIKNATLMRRVESGTSYMKKHPIIRPAVTRAEQKALDAMQKRYDEDLQKLTL